MKISIIGSGRVFNHYDEYVFNSDFTEAHEITIFSNSYLKKSNRYNYCENIHGLIQNKPDFALILTPSGSHYNHIKYFLEHNINVLTEKPIALRMGEIKTLMEIADDKKILLDCVFQNRYNETVVNAKKMIDEGLIGEVRICSVQLHWSRNQDYYEDKWHGKWKMDGGVTSQQAIHHLDIIRYLNDDVVETSSCQFNLINSLEAEDTMIGMVKYKNGSIGTVELTTALRPNDKEACVTIIGTEGFIEIEGVALNKIGNCSLKDKIKEEKLKKSSFEVKNGYGISHPIVIKNFMENIKGGASSSENMRKYVNTHELVHGLYSSSEMNGQWVKVGKVESKKLGQ